MKAPCLDPAFTPVTSTGCLANWALLVGAQRSPDSRQSFHNFLPQFDAVVWLLLPLSGREPKRKCKGMGACHFVWLFFPFQSPGCCLINALLTYTCARGGQGTFTSQKLCPQFIHNLCTVKATAIKYPPVTQHLAQP